MRMCFSNIVTERLFMHRDGLAQSTRSESSAVFVVFMRRAFVDREEFDSSLYSFSFQRFYLKKLIGLACWIH